METTQIDLFCKLNFKFSKNFELFVINFYFCLGECGLRYTSENIVGGELAQPGEFPFMALIGYKINGAIYFLCGGTLINKFYVLTAAHCHSTGKPIK